MNRPFTHAPTRSRRAERYAYGITARRVRITRTGHPACLYSDDECFGDIHYGTCDRHTDDWTGPTGHPADDPRHLTSDRIGFSVSC